MAVVQEVHIQNRCAKPVLVHEAGGRSIAPGGSLVLAAGAELPHGRLSLLFGGAYINENLAVLELNGMFARVGAPTPKRNLNFIAQWGFIDLPLEVALWADSARTRLACRDGRARCTYAARDCETVADGSARFEQRDGHGFCRSVPGGNLSDPRACVSGYAAYVSDRCEVFDRDSGRWTPQGRSVGYSHKGWTAAGFSDGAVLPSTLTGREGDGPAVTYECWEAPCAFQPEPCIAARRSSVGNSGFAIECDEPEGLLEVAVMEVTACPAATGQPRDGSKTTSTTTTTATTTTSSLPSAQGHFEGVDGGTDRACRGAGPGDSRASYYSLSPAASLKLCESRCLALGAGACAGVEFGPGGRCEVWTRPGGIGASAARPGYTCRRLLPPASPGGPLAPADGGAGRACRGAHPGDSSPAYYDVVTAGSLEACQGLCGVGCVGVEFGPGGRCELWKRPGGVGATAHVPGYSCFRREAAGAVGAARAGACSFPGLRPFVPFYWDTSCTREAKGCLADGTHTECRFCGEWIFKDIACPA